MPWVQSVTQCLRRAHVQQLMLICCHRKKLRPMIAFMALSFREPKKPKWPVNIVKGPNCHGRRLSRQDYIPSVHIDPRLTIALQSRTSCPRTFIAVAVSKNQQQRLLSLGNGGDERRRIPLMPETGDPKRFTWGALRLCRASKHFVPRNGCCKGRVFTALSNIWANLPCVVFCELISRRRMRQRRFVLVECRKRTDRGRSVRNAATFVFPFRMRI
jgi:hypothetical protein